MKEKRKRIISVVALVLIVVLIVTATYAYFAAQTGNASSTDINITTATVDNLTFETGDAISINATQTNFATGLDSLSDDTYAKATLIANNDTNSASANYYVYLSISTNEFEYTTNDSTAELILSITMDGTEITSLDGFNYVSVTDGNSNVISGFDITTASGLITIADNYLIESTGIEVDGWEITVTFVNLDSDQSGNAGKSFSASLIIQQEEILTFANYLISLYTEDGENAMYYFDGEGDYTNSDLEAVDYSYRYSGGAYELTNYAIEEGYETVDDTSNSTDTGVVNFYCSIGTGYSYIGQEGYCSSSTHYYYLNYDSDQTQYGSYDAAIMKAISDGYVEEEVNNNYVYFGSSGYCYYDGNDVYNFDNWSTTGVTESSCNTVYKTIDDYYFDASLTDYISEYGEATWNDGDSICETADGNSIALLSTGNAATEEQCSGTVYYNSYYSEYEVGIESVGSGEWEEYYTDDNLYRIIGVFQNDSGQYEVKMIKADYANSDLLGTDGDYAGYEKNYSLRLSSSTYYYYYYWNNTNYSISINNSGYANDWSYSELNKTNLNYNYLNNIGEKWSNLITYHTWIVGGNTSDNIINTTPLNVYTNEIINPISTANIADTVYAKVGLMYVSDYSFAENPIYWSTNLYVSSSNWMYMGTFEWTITRYSENTYSAYNNTSGGLNVISVYKAPIETRGAVRPTFYLNSSVVYTGGSGTIDNPYTIA